MQVASMLGAVSFDDVFLDLALRNEPKRGPRKMPHCLSRSKSSNQQSKNIIIDGVKTTTKSKLLFLFFAFLLLDHNIFL